MSKQAMTADCVGGKRVSEIDDCKCKARAIRKALQCSGGWIKLVGGEGCAPTMAFRMIAQARWEKNVSFEFEL